MTLWQGVAWFLITFAGTFTAGLVLAYRHRLVTLTARCLRAAGRLVRSPCRALWTRFQQATTRPVSDGLTNLEQRTDSLDSILRSIQERLPTPTASKQKSETSSDAPKETSSDE